MKYENYTNPLSDSGAIRYTWGTTHPFTAPIYLGNGNWKSVEDVYLNTSDKSTASIDILGPNNGASPDTQMYLTNFKVYKINPTYTEDFSDGKIDSRFSTNSKFNYSVIDDNGGKALKIDMPKNSLSVGTYDDVLTSKKTLAPASPEPSVIQEGITYLTHQSVGSTEKNSQFNIVNFLDSNLFPFPSNIWPQQNPSYSPFGYLTLCTNNKEKSYDMPYGIMANRSSADMINPTTLYIKDIQLYKGEIKKVSQSTDLKRVAF